MSIKSLIACLLCALPFAAGAQTHTVMVDANNNIVVPATAFPNVSAQTLTLNGSTIGSWTNVAISITNILVSSTWAQYPAVTNVDMAGFNVVSGGTINADAANIGTVAANTGMIDAVMATTAHIDVDTVGTANITTGNVTVANVTTESVGTDNITVANIGTANIATGVVDSLTVGGTTTTNLDAQSPSHWAKYPAEQTVDGNGQNITNVALISGASASVPVVITNASVYGSANVKMPWNGSSSYAYQQIYTQAPTGDAYAQYPVVRVGSITTTFGSWSNNFWTPGTAHSNIYYVACNWTMNLTPSTTSTGGTWQAIAAAGVSPAGFTTTNFTYGDGEFQFTDLSGNGLPAYLNYNHVLKVNGDDWIGYYIYFLNGVTVISTVNNLDMTVEYQE